jgi:RNA polymerase sigma-70 factor (ECF subfamily)
MPEPLPPLSTENAQSGDDRVSEVPHSGARARLPRAALARREFEWLRLLVIKALRRVTSPKDPEYEDLIQSALAGVLSALEARGHDGQHFSPWVVSVARNIVVDRLRARARERRLFESDDGSHEPSSVSALEPEHLTHVRRELRRLNVALNRLGPRRATVVYLHDVVGRDLSQIAHAMGISAAAAQSRLVRGRRQLLRHIAAGRSQRP